MCGVAVAQAYGFGLLFLTTERVMRPILEPHGPRREDHARRAVEAALGCAAAVASRFNGDLRIGIGVNSGRALVGTIGGGGRLDFTAIGDVVNTAARVEAETRSTGDDVLIAEPTRALLGDGATGWIKRLDARLKGKADPVAVYAAAEPQGYQGMGTPARKVRS